MSLQSGTFQKGRSVLSVRFFCLALGMLVLGLAIHASEQSPFPAGTHRQLVREFSTIREGLPSDEIRALTVARDGTAFAAAGSSLARLSSEEQSGSKRWIVVPGPSNVTALFTPPGEV